MLNIPEIILPEHNSSRLLFITNEYVSNGDIDLKIEDTTTSQYCTEKQYYQYSNNWLLGKLNNNVWLLEDVGQYDTNHEHTANIFYINPNTNKKIILCTVKRIFEYGEECDRMYTQYSGGMKLMLLDPNKTNFTANMYLKYERNLPGFNEEVIEEDGKYYVVFNKYDGNTKGITDILAISNELVITNDHLTLLENEYIDNEDIEIIDDSSSSDSNLIEEEIENNLNIQNFVYCSPKITNVSIDFTKLSVNFDIESNYTNDIKLGIIGINSYNKKFISHLIVDKCIEPAYFVVQPPKNMSWICYRAFYNLNFGIYYMRRNMPANVIVGFLNREDSSLTGHYGVYDEETNEYVYEISFDKHENFNFIIPKYYWNWKSIEFRGADNSIRNYDGYQPITFFNDLDGLYYKVYSFTTSSLINKIIIRYENIIDNIPLSTTSNIGNVINYAQQIKSFIDIYKSNHSNITKSSDFILSQYGRINRYDDATWDIAGGKIDDELKTKLDNLFSKLHDVEVAVLPNGDEIDMPHFWAVINTIMNNFGDLGGWAGDLVELAALLKTSPDETFPSIGGAFDRGDWNSDADAYNIMKDYSGNLINDMQLYFTDDLTETKRVNSFITSEDIETRFNNSSNRIYLLILMQKYGVNNTNIHAAAEKMQEYLDTYK